MDKDFNRRRPVRRKRKVFRQELFIAIGFAGILVYMLSNGKKWEHQEKQAQIIQRDREIYQYVDYFQRRDRWNVENGFPPNGFEQAQKLKRQISTYGTPGYRAELKQLYHDLYYESGKYGLWGVKAVGGGPGAVNNWGWPASFNQDPTKFPTFEESEPLENDAGGVNSVHQTARGSDVIPQPSAQLLNRLNQQSHP